MRAVITAASIVAVSLLCSGNAAAQTLTLADVLARARAEAPEIVRARLAVDEARGRLIGASLRFQSNPDFDVSLGNRQQPTSRSTDFQVGAAQAFEPGGRRSARIAGANALIEQETATVEETTRQVVRDAALAFYRAVHDTERVRLLATSVELANGIFQAADRRFKAGDITVLDVNLARSMLARAKAERQAAEADLAASLGTLQRLLQLESAIAVQGNLAVAGPPDSTALDRAVDQRPELRVLEAAIREAEADSAIARTFGKPNYGAGLRYEREGGDNIVLGSLTFSFPVFSKGQELAATGSARATRLRAELAAARARARIELRSALATYEQRAAAVRVIETEALPSLAENDVLTTRSFDAGQIGMSDVLLIRRELLETRTQYLSLLLEAALARVVVDAAASVLR